MHERVDRLGGHRVTGRSIRTRILKELDPCREVDAGARLQADRSVRGY